jgi:UDP-glucose 4-epimerase
VHHLIIGGAGFIGSNLANLLANGGENVQVVDNLSVGNQSFLEPLSQIELLVGDVNQKPTWTILEENLRGKEVFVWHLAANSDIQKGATDTELDFRNTLTTTLSLIESLDQFKVKGIVFASSSAVYGEVNKYPSESDSLDPVSFYGTSKLASENFLKIKCKISGTPLWIFRFANVVGTPSTHGVILDFCKKLNKDLTTLNVLGNGTQTKAYIHVDDLLNAMSKVTSECPQGGTWNLGPLDDGISVREIAELVCTYLSPTAKISYEESSIGWFGDISQIVINSKKLAEDVDFDLPTSKNAIEKAISEICKQIEKNR